MSARYTVQTAVTFDESQPNYLLVEWFANKDNAGRCVGQFFTIEEAIAYARIRMNAAKKREPLLEHRGSLKRPATDA